MTNYSFVRFLSAQLIRSDGQLNIDWADLLPEKIQLIKFYPIWCFVPLMSFFKALPQLDTQFTGVHDTIFYKYISNS